MKIGVPTEIKKGEYRVGLTPEKAAIYVQHGHRVFIQKGAGIGSGYPDSEYVSVGGELLDTAEDIYGIANMIIKVKEPLEAEYPLMREGQIIFTYFHLAASRTLTEAVLRQKIIAIAYETIKDANNGLPCLKPMSEVAGRLAVQEGARFLEKTQGGRGILLSGVPGVQPGTVVVLGAAGSVGRNAIQQAVGLHAKVMALDIYEPGLAKLRAEFGEAVKTLPCTPENVAEALKQADLVISGVLVPGGATPKLIRKEHLATMKPGSVIVDVAIDQGGSCETSHVTYHDNPTYVVDSVIHYCVGNMPGAVPRTASEALCNATTQYGVLIADLGYKNAFREDSGLAEGLNTYFGVLTCLPVATLFQLPYQSVAQIIR